MSSEPTLAYTVHHKGRKYTAGSTAKEVGPVAAEFGDHVWEGGKAPAKSALPKEGDPDGGTNSATPGVPRSGLPGPADTSTDLATALRLEGGENTPGTGPGETAENAGGPGVGDGTNTPGGGDASTEVKPPRGSRRGPAA
jgi:hypothetical protein